MSKSLPKQLFLLVVFFMLLQPAYASIRFLTISDIHYGPNNKTGDGQDTNDKLLNLAMDKLNHLTHRVQFIITLGDFPTHMLLHSPVKATYIKKVFHELYKADDVEKPIFYVTGNNDSLIGNYQPFSSKGISPLSLAKDWHGACAHCQGLLIDDTHLQTEGYYSTYVIPGNKNIILIALNSMEFYRHSIFIQKYPHQHEAALKQLRWLKHQLETHHAKQLLIALHIPPGDDYKGKPFWHDQDLRKFIELLTNASPRYGQISLLTSHTHMDDIREIHLKNGSNIYAYATPSISRIHHNYPAMKIFNLTDALEINNYTTFYTSSDSSWENEHYHSSAGHNPIFPLCDSPILEKCLNPLNNAAICNALNHGKFYGVKSPKVDGSVCTKTLPVNKVF